MEFSKKNATSPNFISIHPKLKVTGTEDIKLHYSVRVSKHHSETRIKSDYMVIRTEPKE